MKKTLRKDLTIRLWCDTIANVRVREGRDIPQWQWGCWRLPLETFSIHAPSWEVALITLHHATAKDLHMSFLRPLYYPRRGHSFFYLTFEFRFDTIITELIEKQPMMCLWSRDDRLTIGRGDAPTLPPSGLWSSEKGLGRLSTHVRPCEFGGSTAGSHGERNISQETHAREQALHYFSECGSAGRKGGTALRES